MLPILSIRIKELRKDKKWSQRELGEKVDVSESFVSKVESGKKQPSREVTTKFSEVFNVTTDYLLGRSEDPELNEEEDKVVSEEGKNIMSLIESLPEDERKKAWEQLEMYVTYMQNKKITNQRRLPHTAVFFFMYLVYLYMIRQGRSLKCPPPLDSPVVNLISQLFSLIALSSFLIPPTSLLYIFGINYFFTSFPKKEIYP